jgi:uncharacterized protein (DUF58 family)
MRTLIPEPVRATATLPEGRAARWLGFALTPRALWLLAGGVLLAVPAFFRPHLLWMMPAWDMLLLVLAVVDARTLPPPDRIAVERRFQHAPVLGQRTQVLLTVEQTAARPLRLSVLDALHPALALTPVAEPLLAFSHEAATAETTCWPARRGDLPLGKIYLRYRSAIGLAERWATVPLEQTVRVLPAGIGSKEDSIFLLRARQMELEKRRVRRIGLGREFESLRDYQAGDELRNLSWTATARRGKPITRTFTVERSQQVWVVLDAGRLSRTSFEAKLPVEREAYANSMQDGPTHGSSTPDATTHGSQRHSIAMHAGQTQRRQPHSTTGLGDLRFGAAANTVLDLNQLDQAASAAMLLAQVVDRSGDRSALLAYGRAIQQRILPGKGALHLRRMLDALALVHTEAAEADHRRAAARLRQMQGRRSLIFWITEMAESASTPEVALAVAELARQHLVVLVLLEHPELEIFARSKPGNAAQMFAIAAANEMLERRRGIVAQLQRGGVLVVETSPAKVGVAAINQYLEIKARGTL